MPGEKRGRSSFSLAEASPFPLQGKKSCVPFSFMRLKLIACEIFYRELCAVVARSVNQIDIEFLPKGLHDIGTSGMRERLQTVIDGIPPDGCDAVLLGYGLCNNGTAGLEARCVPLVLPRAHDCITLFFGSRDRYLDYFRNNSGTYFLTTGWIERGEASGELRQISIQRKSGMDMTYEELVERYGEENARYLHETLYDMTRHYSTLAFIDMGVGPERQFEEIARERARSRGWQYLPLRGDMTLLERLVFGRWNNEDFLVVEPGHRIVASLESGIIASERIAP
jgi:hypothetical protein